MLFLVNPGGVKPRAKRKGATVAVKRKRKLSGAAKAAFLRRMAAGRRKRRTVTRTRAATGGTVAKRRRKRRVVRRATARRRRRSPVTVLARRRVYATNPRRRRRRTTHHRRRYHRNPGMGSIVGTIKQGVKDGALVLIGQTAQGRASAVAARFNPLTGLAGAAVNEIGSAVLVTMLARKFTPNMARMASAGAFSNAVRHIVAAVSPGTAALLGDHTGYYTPAPYGYDTMDQGVGAYAQMGAYPGGGLGDGAGDEHVVYS